MIAGAGIGGLALALALSRIGVYVEVLEQSHTLGEGGAGLQLSPNAYGILKDWGLDDKYDLTLSANFPVAIQARDAATNDVLSELQLGARAVNLYGAHYATMHRADLHKLLLNAVRKQPKLNIHRNAKVERAQDTATGVKVSTERDDLTYEADALVGCDGLWSFMREHVVGTDAPIATGHVAWRALLPFSMVPNDFRQDCVHAWMAPHMHIVAYPVRRGEFLNIVVVTEDDQPADTPSRQSWSRDATGLSPLDVKNNCQTFALNKKVIELLKTVNIGNGGGWTRWTLFDRAPISSSLDIHNPQHPRYALLGDAAHPMRPYLAQGAAMALEDAQALALAVQENWGDLPKAFQTYANRRWERVAKVQTQSRRNGDIYHMQGMMRMARNVALRLAGPKLMEMPWLYQGPRI